MTRRTRTVRVRHRASQHGLVVLIALVTVLAMALSAVALVRTVDATTRVAGNLGFTDAAVAAADSAIEQAVDALFERSLIAAPTLDDLPHGYVAVHQPGESARGVPNALVSLGAYPPAAPVIDAGNGNQVRYLIERMCTASGPPTDDACSQVGASDLAPAMSATLTAEVRVPLFRETIRVDGPAGAVAFVQVWLADLPGRRRLSWRALAD